MKSHPYPLCSLPHFSLSLSLSLSLVALPLCLGPVICSSLGLLLLLHICATDSLNLNLGFSFTINKFHFDSFRHFSCPLIFKFFSSYRTVKSKHTLHEWQVDTSGTYSWSKVGKEPWLVWFSGLSVVPQTRRLTVQFPGKAHTWVSGQVPGWGHASGNQSMFLSSFSLHSSHLKNKFKKSF